MYRLSQTGLRLRSLLGHAVYGKVLRTKAGGGGSEKDKDGKEQEETLGKVNSEYFHQLPVAAKTLC